MRIEEKEGGGVLVVNKGDGNRILGKYEGEGG